MFEKKTIAFIVFNKQHLAGQCAIFGQVVEFLCFSVRVFTSFIVIVKVNVLPLPGELETEMLPFIISHSFLLMESPRPVP